MNYEEALRDIELQSKGFPKSNITLTQKVYTDLVLAKKWKNVKYKACQKLQQCVIIATEPNKTDQLVILPVFQNSLDLSLKKISDIFSSISSSLSIQLKRVTLGIYSSDSTLIYYHISEGLVKPTERNLSN